MHTHHRSSAAPVGFRAVLAGIAAAVLVSSSHGQGTSPVKPDFARFNLTEKEVLDGWIALFDGETPFGFEGAMIEASGKRHTLRGGKTTTEFAEYQLRAEVLQGGTIKLGGQPRVVAAGTVTLPCGRRGVIELGPEVVVAGLVLRPTEAQSLFNGRDLDGWREKYQPNLPTEKTAKWSVERGVIHARGGPGALEYVGKTGLPLYGDLIAQLTIRTCREHTNGGFFFRNQPGTALMGYEAQIHNKVYDTKAGVHGWSTGAIDDRQHARRLMATDGQPFVMTVVAHGPHIATWVNGYQTTDWTDARAEHENPRRGRRVAPGTIQLQAHDPQTDIEFHAIRIREMSKLP